MIRREERVNIFEYTSIVVRGAGVYARRFMGLLSEISNIAPDLFDQVKQRINCFIDIDLTKVGSHLESIPIHGVEYIYQIEVPILYVIAVADKSSIIDEAENFELKNEITIISDGDFIYNLHYEIVYGNYNIIDAYVDRIRIAGLIAEIEKNSMFYSSLFYLMHEQGVSPAELVKSMRFLYMHNIPKCLKEGIKHNYRIGSKKRLGIFLTNYFGGGAERVVSKLLPVYNEMGYDSILFTDNVNEKEYKKPEYVKRINFRNRLYSNFDCVIDERYRAILENDITIACFHIPYEGYMVYYETMLCYLMGISVVIESHTSFINSIVQRGNLAENVETYRLANKLIVLSTTDEIFWRKLGVDARFVLNPCNEINPVQDRMGHMLREEHSIVWVGRIDHKYKRVLDIIPIIKEIKKSVYDIKLYVVGDASNKKDYEQLKKSIKDNCLSETIILCGYHEDVNYYYEKSSMLIMTSPGEGFPMVITEAKAHGIPTVMYDIPYLEMVKDGRGIITVEQRDTKALAKTVVELLEDKHRLDILSKDALESYKDLEKYDLNSAWQRVFEENIVEINKDECIEEIVMVRRLLEANNASDELLAPFVT